jgi:hypothetical protein
MWLELLRERPALVADLLNRVRRGLVPAFERAQLESNDLSEHAPVAYHECYDDEGETEAEDMAKVMVIVILAVLSARRVAVPEGVRARIIGCTEFEQLIAWARRAATADSIGDLFDDGV